MGLTAMWTHGTALVVESTDSLARNGRFGWGADLLFKPGESSWLHCPLPTPVLLSSHQRARLLRVFILFNTPQNAGSIRAVHVWDGSTKIHQVKDFIQGSHLGIDNLSTFSLPAPREVFTGVCVSFAFTAAVGLGTEISPRLHVAAVGGDFETP